ncbi:hypothetical protein ACFPVY_13555 [Flavobacterium qiangtangense]|uniref:Helix-turn-helix transcriptional regulator n=1 Tax=Flavobacterium qiangtangense TaxID=1442595 RepID=A0ABW1PRR7_9FLAO
MQTQIDEVKTLLLQRIHKRFLGKFDGNNRKFAIEVGCDEKTVRDLFSQKHGMTMNLFFKIALALDISPSELLDGLEFKKKPPQ